eukprot:m.201314 g.201314  ORF g.201314 m.201314 type:complete len:166 (-) comp21375_c0_seq1:71-568(-)
MQGEAGPRDPSLDVLLDPESLAFPDLIQALHSRNIPVPDGAEQDDVLQLYRQHVVPRPQRAERGQRNRRRTVKRADVDVDQGDEDGAPASATVRAGSPMKGISVSLQVCKATRIHENDTSLGCGLADDSHKRRANSPHDVAFDDTGNGDCADDSHAKKRKKIEWP